MHLLFRYLVAKRMVERMSPEQKDKARRMMAGAVAGQMVGGAFPAAHPVLSGMLRQRVAKKLLGDATKPVTREELRRRVGAWAADTWIDNNFPTICSAERSVLKTAITDAQRS